MNNLEKLEEATMRALQGKLNESKSLFHNDGEDSEKNQLKQELAIVSAEVIFLRRNRVQPRH